MKIEKVCTETYTFEQGDMFIFKQEAGCYDKEDFIILWEKEPRDSWKIHNNRTLLNIINYACYSESNLVELIKGSVIEYIGVVEMKDPTK